MEGGRGETQPKNGEKESCRSATVQQSNVAQCAVAISLSLLLIQACASGDVATVTNLISKQNADPFSEDESGRTPLGAACEGGHLQLARYLIETERISPGFRGADGSTPLHVAAKGGHLTVVKYLVIEQGVNPSCKDKNDLKPLDYAKNDDVRNFLIHYNNGGTQANEISPENDHQSLHSVANSAEHQASLKTQSGALPSAKVPVSDAVVQGELDGRGSAQLPSSDPALSSTEITTALLVASREGNLTKVKRILKESEIDPLTNCRDEHDNTPLHLASRQGHLDIVKYLVEERNCDLGAVNKDHNTPLHLSALKGRLEILKYMITERGCDPNCRGENGANTLHLACKSGCSDMVRFLIEEKNVDPMSKDSNDVTPLHEAVQYATLDVVKYLVEEKNCDVRSRNKYDIVPLHCAAAKGKLDAVQYLIVEKGCDPMCRGWRGVTPLHSACESGWLNVVKYLAEEMKVDCSVEFQNGTTPLHTAAKFGTLDVVRYLIEEQNCVADSKDKYGGTPLFAAASGGKLDTVKYLINERGCDPMLRSINGETVLTNACAIDRLDIVKYLIEEANIDKEQQAGNGATPLHAAVHCGTLPLVRYLVEEQKCNIQCKNHFGNTPLIEAVMAGKFDIVKYLIKEGGCDPMDRGLHGTPLHYACGLGRLDMVKYLVEDAGVDCSCRDGSSAVPLHVAAHFGTLDVVRYLVDEQQCETEYRDMYENTPLHRAIHGNKFDIMKYLIDEKRCDPMTRGEKGSTPLNCACATGNIDMVKYFLDDKKVNPYSPDGMGASSLHIAVDNGHLSVLKLLIEEYQCDEEVKDRAGMTLAELAEKRGHTHIASYLKFIQDSTSIQLRRIVDTQLKKFIKKATPTGTELGRGTYGRVIELSSAEGIVAGKIFNASTTLQQLSVVVKVCGELNMMMQLSHQNIVQCKGVGLIVDQPLPLLLMERMMTSLHACVLDPENSDLSLRRKISILLDTASGLEYLHSLTPTVIHRDLSATNVLLDSQLTAKITDFGNSRIMDLNPSATPEIATPNPGTLEYMPPEAQGEDYDPSLDVFSFGHLSLFTVIQSPLHPLLPPNFTDSRGKIHPITEVNRREKFLENAKKILSGNSSFLDTMKQCLHNRPAMRPRSSELVARFQKFILTTAADSTEGKKGLDVLNLYEIKCVLEPVLVRWKHMGLALRLDPTQLNTIEEKNRKLEDCLTEMLKLWLSKKYDTKKFGEPSWSTLAKAVGHSAGGKDAGLAEGITKRYAGADSC